MDTNRQGEKPINQRQLAKIQTQQKAFVAARALFLSGGYAKATLRNLAKKMGMSTGALYASFDSKSDVLLGLMRQELEPHDTLLAAAAAQEGASLDRVVRICVADYLFFSERLHLFEALALLETDPSHTKQRTARSLAGKRRECVWRHLEAVLHESRCGTAAQTKPLAECIMCIHFYRCRDQAIANCTPEAYRHALKELLGHLFVAHRTSCAA